MPVASAHRIPNEHRHKVNQFILAHPSPHKLYPLLDGFESSMLLERVRHHDDFPKPGRGVRWVHLDTDDRIGHLPLLPFSLVFSQEDTFLPPLPVFQDFLPLFAHSLRIPWEGWFLGTCVFQETNLKASRNSLSALRKKRQDRGPGRLSIHQRELINHAPCGRPSAFISDRRGSGCGWPPACQPP
jgi:hypothetical protein